MRSQHSPTVAVFKTNIVLIISRGHLLYIHQRSICHLYCAVFGDGRNGHAT
jgi:hypothetical protein